MNTDFLPTEQADVKKKGWNEVDIILITGDAYVDHPSFGTAVIGRVLESHGYRVGIIAMPDWRDSSSIEIFGRPRLFFGVTSGNVDSMISRYTAFKRFRSDDPYAPGGKTGHKPERAVIVYCNLIKSVYKDVPIVIGGIEASMRRVAHYDFWSDKVRRSIIEDTRADILVYGMGEQQIVTIARRIESGQYLNDIPGTVTISRDKPETAKLLPSEEEVMNSKESFIEFYNQFYRFQHKILAQPAGKRFIIHYPQSNKNEFDAEELDAIYNLPFTRLPHPKYEESVPAFEMIKNSVTSHRGCFSGCSFCSLGLHQGKRIISRSQGSILNEVKEITQQPYFKGHISDIGGPSANMYGFECKIDWKCPRESCMFPDICPNLVFHTSKWTNLLEKALEIKNVSHVTLGSGLRYDLLMKDMENRKLLKKIIKSHVSGQLKIAPEHTANHVLRAMRKNTLFELKEFYEIFQETTKQLGKKQYIIPYFMSCHPGSNIDDMKNMKKEIKSIFGFVPKQVQAFIPLPMTLSSVIYYTGIDPLTREKFYTEKDLKKRRQQHNVFFE